MPRPRTALLAALLHAAAVAPMLAQDDLRDTVTRADGKVFTGRLLTPHSPDELLLLQGGKRVRLARADLASTDLLADRIRESCARRLRLKDSPKAQWFLVEWAEAQGLPGLARAQAMLLVLDDDGNAPAHEFLGHKKGPKGWLWELDGRWLAREQLENAILEKPYEIAGERFAVVCDGGLRTNVAALLDLEHLAVVCHDRLGAGLQLRESLAPMRIVCSRSVQTFPKWGFRPVPYYVPAPHGDVGRTFYAGAGPVRPEKLFFVGTQALLHHCLIGEVARANDRDRTCPWLEVGFGMYLENLMAGPAGFAAPGELRAQDLQALSALGRDFRLSQLLHLPMYGGFYLMDDTATALHWSASTMFVAWLLDPGNDPQTREPFLAYAAQALGEKKGDSSSLFDRAMGRRVEEFEAPFTKWLAKQAGF
ncbi:MAG: hypothetical protein FJ265_11265 [Planctomycetes bacterium]|nr:hypothetical protein [Planctomycetota bacterium]